MGSPLRAGQNSIGYCQKSWPDRRPQEGGLGLGGAVAKTFASSEGFLAAPCGLPTFLETSIFSLISPLLATLRQKHQDF